MRFEGSLRTRFLLATSVLVMVLCAVFALAVHRFIELLEDEMLNRELARQMQDFELDFATHPQRPPPNIAGLRGYVVRTPQESAALPQQIAALRPGIHEDVSVGGHLYYVAASRVQGAALYLVLDSARVESLESSVVSVAVGLGAIAIGLAALVGWALARTVLRPVTELAAAVGHLDPSGPMERLERRFANREVSVIAAAFDDYVIRLRRVLEREQAFAEDASHELRTPLSIISSAAELLAEEPALSESGRERVLRIRRACSHTHSLIEALLFLARGEKRGGESCALDQVVLEAVELIEEGARSKSIDLSVDTVPVTVTAPPAMAACVVNNLLSNALHFTQRGQIQVRLSPEELRVRDSGIGIPPADLSHIFERRYRGAGSRGLGLGLYLVSRICERLGWEVEAHSIEGAGTQFSVRLTGAPSGI